MIVVSVSSFVIATFMMAKYYTKKHESKVIIKNIK